MITVGFFFVEVDACVNDADAMVDDGGEEEAMVDFKR